LRCLWNTELLYSLEQNRISLKLSRKLRCGATNPGVRRIVKLVYINMKTQKIKDHAHTRITKKNTKAGYI